MKQRVLSVALALCLCISSQSVVHASQEGPSQPKDVLAADEPGTDEDMAADSQKDPSPQDEIPTEAPAEEPDAGDGEISVPQVPPLQQEDILPNETEDKPDINGDGTAAPQETSLPLEASLLQENDLLQEDDLPEESLNELVVRDGVIPSPAEVYESMTALKNQDMYQEGAVWTDDEPYSSSKPYRWNGGPIDGKNIVATGCVAFAFALSDAAFGSLPARSYAAGGFSFEDIKVGDILRVNNDIHTVIVLEVNDAGVMVAEGNIGMGDHIGKVHWGRGISKEEVMRDASHYITRYPEGYVPPDDPGANESVASGNWDGGPAWNLTKAGTLSISGQGAMPDFGSAAEQPWDGSKIRMVIIEDGVTSIGSNAFGGSQVISADISSSVKTIGDSAFRGCQNLSSVTVREGVETINGNAFRACTKLTSIALPASIGEIGEAAFFECTEMQSVTFAPGSKKVKMGDMIFARCWKLAGIKLPSSVDRISKEMFLNCGMLAGVEIPQGAESIGESAFASCYGLTAVIVPDSVTVIERTAFEGSSLKDIYFTGTEEQWDSISKTMDTVAAISKATVHYNYVPPAPAPDPNPGDGDNDSSTEDNPGGGDGNDTEGNPGGGDDNAGDNEDNPGGDPPGNHPENIPNGNNTGSSASGSRYSGIKEAAETWKPITPEEKKRYACMGKEAVQYIPSKENAYQIAIENAIQGPLCFQSFEAVLGDYTIGRTYNIYPSSDTAYRMEKPVQFTIEIPSAIYKEGREYKMICVTEGGQPIIYNDSDSDPGTITIKTNQFYAYALIYK